MKHMVRPVWIALAGTTVPADIEERCRKSFKHIQQYFLKEIGKTFQVAELQIIQTHLTAKYFQEYRSENVPLLNDLNQFRRDRGYREYGPKSPRSEIFFFNLVAFIRRTLNTDNTQAWIVFIPAGEKERNGVVWGTASAVRIGSGGYAVISAYLLSKEFDNPNLPIEFHLVNPPDQRTWGSGERVEGVIAHELGHIFGLYNLKMVGMLMGYRSDELQNCLLSYEERWTLSRSPFFTEEEKD